MEHPRVTILIFFLPVDFVRIYILLNPDLSGGLCRISELLEYGRANLAIKKRIRTLILREMKLKISFGEVRLNEVFIRQDNVGCR